MSSLLQVPLIQQTIGSDRTVAIVCAQKRFLTDTHLLNVGIDLASNFIVAGTQDEYGCPQFDQLWDHERRPDIPEAAYDAAEADIRVLITLAGAAGAGGRPIAAVFR